MESITKSITTKYTLFHRTSTGAIKVWSISGYRQFHPLDRAHGSPQHIVTREWGLLNGKIQVSDDVMKTKGIPGSKSFRDTEAVMHDTIIRHLAKQIEEGWVTDVNDVRESVELSAQDLDFTFIPKNFAPQKPLTGLKPEELAKWMTGRKCQFQLKRNGIRVFLLKTPTGELKLYTRKLEDLTPHFMPFLEDLNKLNIIPNSTIIDGEFLIFELFDLAFVRTKKDDPSKYVVVRNQTVVNPTENFKLVSGITRSDPERALTMYGPTSDVMLTFMPFDVLYSKGESAFDLPYQERIDYIRDFADRVAGAVGLKGDWWTVIPPKTFATFEDGQAFVTDPLNPGYEGLVVWDLESPGVVTMNGKPKRQGCAKWKPKYDADVIATGYEEGKGKRKGQAGAVYISIRKADGTIKPAGKAGSGLTDELAAEIPTWTFPCVVQIKYDDQDEESDKFQFPVFVRKRDDKSLDEVDVFE